MIPPALDVTSELFDAYKALRSNRIHLPYPKVKTYNNIAEYYSHTFLKKGLESLKSSKNTEKPRERNYEWYYDTLGLSEYQRDLSRCTKKKKFRKGKKPVSIVTIPSSPLRSEKVTVCKSDFKEYCQRKYRSLNSTSATMDSKPTEHQTFPSNSVSELSSVSPLIKTEPLDSTSTLQSIKSEASKFLPTSVCSTETIYPISLDHTIKSEPPKLPAASHIIKAELPSTCVAKTELSDSSNDSFTDDVLIFKMKSNLQKVRALKNVNESPVSFRIKNNCLELFSISKYVHDPHQVTNDKKLLKISKPASSCNDSENTPSQVKDSSALLNKQKKVSKKHKICSNGKLKSQKDHKTPKHKKRQSSEKNKDDNLNVLVVGQPEKSITQNIPYQKKCTLLKKNNFVNDSKSNNQPIKKRRKSALKSQENVLNHKKLSTAVEADSKSNNKMSKIKADTSPVANHCTCKFPCGLSHLCTCGYFACAKEVLSKYKIPRKKK